MTSTSPRPQPASVRRRPSRGGIIALVVVIGALTWAWQIDLVRQNAQLFWLAVTGQQWKLRGTIHEFQVWSPALKQSRTVYVYTPADYESPSKKSARFPVLYMLHGAPGLPTDWLRYGRAPEVVERLHLQGKVPEMLVVCPDGQGIGALGDSEYVDAPSQPPGTVGADVGSFIWHDLPAWVDNHYRTRTNPAGRILAGASTGGYGAVNLALRHPNVFGGGISCSGYFTATPYGWARPVWGHHSTQAQLDADSPSVYVHGPSPRWQHTYIFIGDGLEERPPYPQQAAAFVGTLKAADIDYVYKRAPGKHSWDLWRGLLRDALTRYYKR